MDKDNVDCSKAYRDSVEKLTSEPFPTTDEAKVAWHKHWYDDMEEIQSNYSKCIKAKKEGGSRRKKRKMARKSRKNKSRRFRRN